MPRNHHWTWAVVVLIPFVLGDCAKHHPSPEQPPPAPERPQNEIQVELEAETARRDGAGVVEDLEVWVNQGAFKQGFRLTGVSDAGEPLAFEAVKTGTEPRAGMMK